MSERRLRHRIGAPFMGHLSGETIRPLMKGNEMSTKEITQETELTHELIVKLVSELENGFTYDKNTGIKTKDEIKKLKDARRQVSKSVFGRVHEVSYMVNMAIQKSATSVKRISDDSGVSMSTVSRYDWIGATLSNVGLTKTTEKLAQKSLNLLITGVFNKSDMLNIKDVENWKQLIQDKTFKLPSAPKIENVLEGIGNGSYDEALNKLESAISTRRAIKA